MRKVYKYTLPKRMKAETEKMALNRIDKAWELNKDEIIRRTKYVAEGQKITAKRAYNLFKDSVLQYTHESKGGRSSYVTPGEELPDVNTAIERTFRSNFYTQKGAAGVDNLMANLKSDKDLFHDFRKLQGWKYAIRKENMEWHNELGESGGYLYKAPNNNIIAIERKNSNTPWRIYIVG